MRADDLTRLTRLQSAMLEASLAQLRSVSAARNKTRGALEDLSRGASPNADYGLSGAAADLAALAYQRWADSRRAELNSQLARQTAVWLEARDAARTAFGRDQALRALMNRQTAKKPGA